MSKKMIWIAVVVAGAGLLAGAQETPRTMADTYDALADAILSVKQTEAEFVRALLDGHKHGAEAHVRAKNFEMAAAEMALWGNEGDNRIGGVRKRLLEGGHHHNAEGEAKGIYEAGYVIVTIKAKRAALAASAAMRRAGTDAERQQAWKDFLAAVASVAKSD
jgi:hypothetical protein